MTTRDQLNDAFDELLAARQRDDMDGIYTAAIKVYALSKLVKLEQHQAEDGTVKQSH